MLPPKASLAPNLPRDQSTILSLEVLGDREVPDARLTAADRRLVRLLLALAARYLSEEGMMHLAGGAEHEARRKRAAKEAAGR
jgi:hypothetical protein